MAAVKTRPRRCHQAPVGCVSMTIQQLGIKGSCVPFAFCLIFYLVNHHHSFVLRDDYRTFSPSVPDSRISSQRSRGPDDDVEESPF